MLENIWSLPPKAKALGVPVLAFISRKMHRAQMTNFQIWWNFQSTFFLLQGVKKNVVPQFTYENFEIAQPVEINSVWLLSQFNLQRPKSMLQ